MAARTQPFTAEVRQEPGAAIVDMVGEIDAFAEEGLQSAFTQAMSTKPTTILLNFSKVHYINSTGIALIVGLLARARAEHTKMVCYGLSDHYVTIFHITRLSDFMVIAADENSAVAEVA
jgi:anti-anti-sigma factor